MKLKDISRTATFAWDNSSSSSPLIATGAIAGALDESFSNDSQLEIWAPDFGEAQGMRLGGEDNEAGGSISVGSRFNRLAWSAPLDSYVRGVLAAGMETGEINVFDPVKILDGASADDARIFKSDKLTGPVRGLDFNPIQKNLMVAGAINAELFIFDLNNPNTNPIPPGPLSTRLNDITSLQWNPNFSRVFAASSSSGYTSVWDLRVGKEVVSLQYGGGAAKGMGTVGGVAGLQLGKRRGMSDVCWHPEQVSGLRGLVSRLGHPPDHRVGRRRVAHHNALGSAEYWGAGKSERFHSIAADRQILSGHHKGVLSVAWCEQDADLLLSCGKDNRTLCWNPQTGEIIGELPASNDWSFQTGWCPRNPDLLATASFDGHIGIHSLQTTQVPSPLRREMSETATADDFFGALGNDESVDDQTNVLSLRQPPKWLRRPISASFGFGGLLASTSNLPAASGKHHSGVVHLRSVVTEQGILDRATAVHEASGDLDKMRTFYSEKMTDQSDTAWQTLQTLLKANSREELVRLLGFSKEEVASNVAEAIKTFPSTTIDEADIERDPTVPFAEPEKQESKEDASTAQPSEATPSEISASETAATENTAVTDQSLFTDDTPGTPAAAAADFFSSMAAGNLRNPQLDSVIPHKTEGTASSVAATIGSRASSIRSEIKDSNTFRIYPSGESDVDRLITRALVLGDFASAVNLCLASERFADALILAVRGGPELLQSTQTAYFARRTTSLPFLRVFQSIVTEDLVDIVQNADLSEWKVIFVVLCTFARDSDFGNLAEQLGQRLQFKWQMLAGSDSPEAKESAKTARQDATLCYIAARKLEKVVGIWVEEMGEEENQTQATKYTGHAQALQSLIEKVAVFTATTSYVDEDLSTPTESAATAEAGARTYKLAGLYDRYYEYADLLATQGMVDTAAEYVRMTPSDYKGTGVAGFELDKARDRLLSTASGGTGTAPAHGAPPAEQSRQTAAPMSAPGYAPASAPGFPAPAPAPDAAGPASTSGAYNPPNASYETPKHHDPPQSYGYPDPSPYAPSQAYQQSSQYGPSNGYGPPDPQPQGYGVPSSQPYGAPIAPPAPPPRVSANGSNNTLTPPPVPAAQRRDMPGWNDMPSGPPKRPSSAARDAAKPAPIMSPFPMSTDPMAAAGAPQQMQNRGMTPPPPRASQPKMLPPPPRGGPRPPLAQAVAHQASSPHQTQARPPPETGPPSLNAAPTPGVAPRQPAGRGGPPPGVLAGPPPRRALSPLGPQGRVASPLSSQLRSPSSSQPPARVLSPPGQAPPPGSRLAGPPPPGRIPSATQTPPARSASSGTPPQSSPPTKPSHPSGDHSHMPPTSRPIYDTLSAELSRVKQSNLPAHVTRIVDDTERRLNILFDGLNNETVPRQAVDQMNNIAKAMAARDMSTALAMHVELLTNATGEMTAWAPGVKQLIRLGL